MTGAPTSRRVPSLDGLRAISITFVLLGHVTKTADYLAPLTRFGSLSGFGVRVFFVISGFLISMLLFHEMEKSGTVSLAKFYFRRTFRIFPALYFYVAVIAGLAALGVVALRPGDVLHAVTYTTNYHYDRSWYLGHLWSLSVEEQFYLLWPAILLLLGKNRGLVAALLLVLAGPVIRVASLKFHLTEQAGIGESFQSVGDSIATGCLLAGLRPRLEATRRYLAFADSPAFILVPLVALGSAFVTRVAFVFLVGETLQNVGIALTIHWAIRHHEGFVGRILNSRGFVFVGTLSYSIYLWQQFFTHRVPELIVSSFPLNLVCTFAAALGSYYVVERPFLRWRERLEPSIFKRQASKAS